MDRSEQCVVHREASDIRYVPLSLVPIRQVGAYDLAVIASLYAESHADVFGYCTKIHQEFGGKGLRVQVLLADNTQEGLFVAIRQHLQSMDRLGELEIGINHVPTQGKVHGLNNSLTQVESPFVLSVDMNKLPEIGALIGLYEYMLAHQHVDLASARIARTGLSERQIQVWNDGSAYIGKRWIFTGFPEVLGEDEYIQRLTHARGGNFKVAQNLVVHDTKHNLLSQNEKNKRLARHIASAVQLDKLCVFDELGSKWWLSEHGVTLRSEMRNIPGIASLIGYCRTLPPEHVAAFIRYQLLRRFGLGSSGQDIQVEIEQVIQDIALMPNRCTW